MKSKICAAVFLVWGLAMASASHASGSQTVTVRVDTPDFGIRIGHPGGYPSPVIIAPAPVVVAPPVYAPAPVYVPPPAVYVPPRVIYAPAPVIYTPHRDHWERHHHHRRHHHGHHNGHERTFHHRDWNDDGRHIRSVQIRPY